MIAKTLTGAGLVAMAAGMCAAAPAAPSETVRDYGKWGFDLTGRDTSVRPGDDFFAFAIGTYIDRTQIPADRTWYGTVNILRDLSETRVHTILEDAAAKPSPQATGPAAKIGGFYKAFMNEGAVEALDAKPLAADLDAIRAAQDRTQLAALMGRARSGFEPSLFDVVIFADLKDSSRYSVYVDQGGLGMPDRDYYLESQFVAKKQAYQAYIAKMLGMIGWADPEANAKAITEFETRDAAASMTKPALPKIAQIYASTPVDVLKAYMAFHLADNAADALSSRFVNAKFDFDGKTLSGQPELATRWKRAVRATSGTLGQAIGQVYVANYFPPESKAQMLDLVNNLKGAYRPRIQRLAWMSPTTKAKALQKLAAMEVQLGYPKRWRDYSTLEVRPDDLYGNMERGIAWQWQYRLTRLNQPVEREDWDTTPQTVHAFNEGNFNAIVFPAAFLQAPVFDPHADAPVNYGAIGAVIGHEMSHGFDDAGRKFDYRGHLTDWWTPADAKHFVDASKSYGAEYERFPIMDGTHIKGDLTMGENIADLAGVLAALDAYLASLHGKAAPVIDGLTGDQRFFLAYAQYYRNKWREDMLRQLIVSDPHSPDRARVDVVLPNVDAWYKTRNVKPGDKLYRAPDQRVRIW